MKKITSCIFFACAIASAVLFSHCKTSSSGTEKISFYSVSLTCNADNEIACGSRLKPLFIETGKQDEIKESWVNRKGTAIAIIWKADSPDDDLQKDKIIQPLFTKFEIKADLIADAAKQNELSASLSEELLSEKAKGKWYKGMDVDKLSYEEAGAMADSATFLAHKNGLINDEETSVIRKEIEEYMKTELVKVRTCKELCSFETEMKWKQKGYEIYVKHIGIDRAEKVRDLYMMNYKQKQTEPQSCNENDKKTKSSCMKKDGQILQSEITCPNCGHKKMETMPTDICLLRYTCEKCKTDLMPKKGDCCVFCSYGSVKCPSKQG